MTKPSFTAAWTEAMTIYDSTDPSAKVAKVIGGNVAKNINNPDPRQRWGNTCAVRMSYILNKAGTRIPYIPGQTVSGADNQWYFFRVKHLIAFLTHRWGKPDSILQHPPSGGGPLARQRGLVLFEVSGWLDASGHATLWDGHGCYDHCFFNEPGASYRSDKANFWSLQ